MQKKIRNIFKSFETNIALEFLLLTARDVMFISVQIDAEL